MLASVGQCYLKYFKLKLFWMLRLPSPIGFGAAGLSKINFFYYGC
jgi:hypothetical protein